MWIYLQSTGELFYNDALAGVGYSGKGACQNDPAAQNRHNEGPIPCGRYRIGKAFDSDLHGPLCLPLAPSMDNTMFGRSGFLIHGDKINNPGTASNGCIIQDHAVRVTINGSPDKDLEVRAQ